MHFQCCRNQGGQGAIVPSTIFDRKTKLNELLIFTIEPQSCFISVDPEFMLCFQYFKAHIHASWTLDCFLLKKKNILTCGRPAKSIVWERLRDFERASLRSVSLLFCFDSTQNWELSRTGGLFLLWFLRLDNDSLYDKAFLLRKYISSITEDGFNYLNL